MILACDKVELASNMHNIVESTSNDGYFLFLTVGNSLDIGHIAKNLAIFSDFQKF